MSLWWAKRDQLDSDQVRLIEKLDLEDNYLVLGPPGSGKTNVLLRRAQFVRTQGIPNVLVLTFTRALTEFLRTGCYDPNGAEIFPPALINTIESWIRAMYRTQNINLPDEHNFNERKKLMAKGAIDFLGTLRQPKLDAIFIDEAQDLIPEEVELLSARSDRLFFVGDDRQRIFEQADGLTHIKALSPAPHEEALSFHYRLAPEICAMADRILSSVGDKTLEETSHYDGPRPARIDTHQDNRTALLSNLVVALKAQLRAYGDRILEGDRLGIVVPRKTDRQEVADVLESDSELSSKWQILKSKSEDLADRSYSPKLDVAHPILIMTEPACKGLEFRALHWLFVDDLAHNRTDEKYYTIVTRAKTSLDIYHTGTLPSQIARSHSKTPEKLWL